MQIINDRGIHICKSMVAWSRFGNGETPETSGLKGDKLVGKYYVAFDQAYKAEVQALIEGGMAQEEAEKSAPSCSLHKTPSGSGRLATPKPWICGRP